MCGILCRICENPSESATTDPKCTVPSENWDGDHLQNFLTRRGPDVTSSETFNLVNEFRQLCVHVSSHVLWTQGEQPHRQPFVSEDDSKMMLFNGDIYSFEGFEEAKEYSSRINDGLQLFQLFERCSETAEEICTIISKLQGPFAFILLDKSNEIIWFCRDFFGRESLLFSYENINESVKSWTISSVSTCKLVCEVPTFGLFRVDLRSQALRIFPFSHRRPDVSKLNETFVEILKNSGFIKMSQIDKDIEITTHFSPKLKGAPNEGDCGLKNLLNEATRSTSAEDFIRRSLIPLSREIEKFLYYMRLSIKRRVSTLPPYCKSCLIQSLQNNSSAGELSSYRSCNHAKIGVLFSGGLDSTVIAYLAAEALPSRATLDLINVAFSKTDDFSSIPDRETALASYKMLKKRFGSIININLVLVNVKKPEVEILRRERIKYLISPLTSVLDDSLGVCLWFAARGKGYLYDEHPHQEEKCEYTSPIRIVLCGSGADELLGGYGRHRSAYERSGWLGLHAEMQLEIDRISIRNLGRDNRIVSDHGLCPRMPFLDENLVDFLTTRCDLWVKCCPVNEGPLGSRGSGEKLLLRAVGAYLFGEDYTSLALFPKRAMQFGSRIAKLENSKEKGGDSCQRLL